MKKTILRLKNPSQILDYINIKRMNLFILSLILVVIIFIFYKTFIAKIELDDVHPLIYTDKDMFNKAEWLWVIPLYNNDPISNHPEWTKMVKQSGKKIGLHGVKHRLSEFKNDLNHSYIDQGINEFRKAFGFYPTHFKAPRLELSKNNRNYILSKGIKCQGFINQYILSNVLHSEDERTKYKGRLKYE